MWTLNFVVHLNTNNKKFKHIMLKMYVNTYGMLASLTNLNLNFISENKNSSSYK